MSNTATPIAAVQGKQINLALFEAVGTAQVQLKALVDRGQGSATHKAFRSIRLASEALDTASATLEPGESIDVDEKAAAFLYAIRRAQATLDGILDKKTLTKFQRETLPEVLAVLNKPFKENTVTGLSYGIRDTATDRTKIINPTITLEELHTAWWELHRVTPYHGKFSWWEVPDTTDESDQEIFNLSEAETGCLADFIEIIDPFILNLDGDAPFLLTDLIRSIESCFHNEDLGWIWGYFAFRYIHILGTRDPRFLAKLSIKLVDLTLLYRGTHEVAVALHQRMDLPVSDVLERWNRAGHDGATKEAVAHILGPEHARPILEDGDTRAALDTALEHLDDIKKWSKRSITEAAIHNPERRDYAYYTQLEDAAFAFGELIFHLLKPLDRSHGEPFMRKVFLDLICTDVKRASKDLEVSVPSFREAINTRRLEAINARLFEIRTANKERLSQ